MSGDGASGGLLLAHGGHEGGVGLQLAIHLQFGTALACQSGGLHDLIDHFVLGRALGAEAEHGDTRVLEACHAAGGLRRAYGNLCQLVGIGHGGHSHVAHDEHAVLAVLRTVGDEQHGAADTGDTRRALDNLQGGAQGVARGAECSADLSVGAFGLDNHASEIQRVSDELTGLLDGHSLALAEFAEELCQLLGAFEVLGVDECGLINVRQAVLLGQCVHFVWVSNEDDVGQFVGQCPVCSDERTLLGGLGQHDALAVGLRACDDFLNQ